MCLLTTVGRVTDREKQLSVVFRWEITKTRSVEAECKQSVEAREATMFWEEMTVNHDVAGSVPVAVACRIASARYTRLALLALGATPLDKTIIDRFICANPAGGAKQNPLL